jgi:anti-sigma factor RsiW
MNMSYCPQADKIVDYCQGRLTTKEREDLERHMESCELCQRELQIERSIESELSAEFDPGFIENKVKVRLQLWNGQDTRSFWLYAFRMAVYGLTAAVVGFALIPKLVRFLLGFSPDLSRCVQGTAGLLNSLGPGTAFIAILGVCYIAVFIASMYSLAQIRR